MVLLRFSGKSGLDEIIPLISLMEDDESKKRTGRKPPEGGSGCLPIVIAAVLYLLIRLAGLR